MRYFLILLALLIFARSVLAQNQILINEFLIDPQPQMVELINTGATIEDLSGWYIDDNGGTTYFTIPADSIIYPNSCLVFSADFNLNKSSADTIRLFNNTAPPTSTLAQLVDSFSYNSSSGSAISYARLPDGSANWSTASSSFGKFNQSGISCVVTPTPTPTLVPTETPIPTPTISQITPTSTPPDISYDSIFISEVMVYPQSGETEWVEIYNGNEFSVSLLNWYIDDIENDGSSSKIFALNISAKNYASIDLTSNIFNNSGDSVRLLDFDQVEKDSFAYQTTHQGKTYARISFSIDDFCLQEPSKNKPNGSCTESSISSTSKTVPTPTKTKTLGSSTAGQTNSKLPNYNSGSMIQAASPNAMGRQVLGEVTKNPPSKKINLLGLLFFSFSYSILTIAWILVRMRFMGLES